VPNRYLQLTLWAVNPDIDGRSVTATVVLNQRRILERTLASRDPVTYYVELPDSARWALLELTVSREWQKDKALQVATKWVRELPSDAPPQMVVGR